MERQWLALQSFHRLHHMPNTPRTVMTICPASQHCSSRNQLGHHKAPHILVKACTHRPVTPDASPAGRVSEPPACNACMAKSSSTCPTIETSRSETYPQRHTLHHKDQCSQRLRHNTLLNHPSPPRSSQNHQGITHCSLDHMLQVGLL